MDCIFRRSSGVYFARLVVPFRLREIIEKTELVATTGTRDRGLAKIVGCELVARWRRLLRTAEGLDPMDLVQISIGSPILAVDGFLPIHDAEAASGFEQEELLRHASDGKLRLYLQPALLPGFAVPFASLERDAETGGYDVPPPSLMPSEALPTSDPGTLRVFMGDAKVVADEVQKGRDCKIVLFELPDRSKFAFAPAGGFTVTKDTLLLAATEVELLRREFASRTTAEQLAEARSRRPVSAAPRTLTRRISEVLDPYMAERSRSCSADQARRIRTACDLFVELSANPRLSDINRDMLRKYRDELLVNVPANENKIRLRHGTTSVVTSMTAVAGSTWPTISEEERSKRMQWLCGLFAWLAQEKWIAKDFSFGLAGAIRPRTTHAAHAKRDLFTRDDLQQIFSASWFQTGRGTLTKSGTYREFLPYYYWLPLLGLYTGARINELCQLSLSDIRQTSAGVWYIDVNEDDEEETRRVKNAQSRRQIPIHPHLLAWGFAMWRDRLQEEGHRRLFPELLHNETKGYSKAAVKWFSSFLARLGWPRDGKKVFHSFRHTLASECLNNLNLTETITAQISGHQRSTSVLGSTYRKDVVPDELAFSVARLNFDLGRIAAFDQDQGLLALKHALKRKRRTI